MSVIRDVIAAPEQLLIALAITLLLVAFLALLARFCRREEIAEKGAADRIAAAEEKRQRKALKRRVDAARSVR